MLCPCPGFPQSIMNSQAIMRLPLIVASMAALLASCVEARTPRIVRQTEAEYINAADSDNSPVTLSVDLQDTSARNKTAPYAINVSHTLAATD
jgi:L-asparaginase II